MLHSVREHTAIIKDMQFNTDQTMLITASKDKTAKVCNISELWYLHSEFIFLCNFRVFVTVSNMITLMISVV